MVTIEKMSAACRRAWNLLQESESVRIERIGSEGMIIRAEGVPEAVANSVISECACTEPRRIGVGTMWVPVVICELIQEDLTFFETKIRRGLGAIDKGAA